jgi:hypothetical protein
MLWLILVFILLLAFKAANWTIGCHLISFLMVIIGIIILREIQKRKL